MYLFFQTFLKKRFNSKEFLNIRISILKLFLFFLFCSTHVSQKFNLPINYYWVQAVYTTSEKKTYTTYSTALYLDRATSLDQAPQPFWDTLFCECRSINLRRTPIKRRFHTPLFYQFSARAEDFRLSEICIQVIQIKFSVD